MHMIYSTKTRKTWQIIYGRTSKPQKDAQHHLQRENPEGSEVSHDHADPSLEMTEHSLFMKMETSHQVRQPFLIDSPDGFPDRITKTGGSAHSDKHAPACRAVLRRADEYAVDVWSPRREGKPGRELQVIKRMVHRHCAGVEYGDAESDSSGLAFREECG